MKNSFWKRQVIGGKSFALDGIVSVSGGIDPVSNWQCGYTAYFAIDGYNTGFISIEINRDSVRLDKIVGIKPTDVALSQVVAMCVLYPPRVGDVFDDPNKWS